MLIPTQCPQRFLQFAPPSNEHLVRSRVPLDWAMTQNNLGAALVALGERESGTARLEEAVAAYRDTLKDHPKNSPLILLRGIVTRSGAILG